MNETFATETAVLGAMLAQPEIIRATLDRYPPDQWMGQHQAIAEALQAMVDLGEHVSPEGLLLKMQKLGTLVRSGGGARILELVERRALNYEYLLEGLEEHALRRDAQGIAQGFMQRLAEPSFSVEDAVSLMRDHLDRLGTVAGVTDDEMDWPDDTEQPEPEWVIPQLLAVDERLMLTGGEGAGKTMLIRQLCASLAVGHHPWTFERFEPGKVIHVDLENPIYNSDWAYRLLRNRLLGGGVVPAAGFLHRLAPRSWDASSSADVGWLMRKVRRIQPRLIAIGPLKNMSSENLNDEDAAVKVTNVLNRLRAETGAAVVVEAHAGHSSRGEGGDWRPRGSSAFLGWPEFGLGLKPVSKPPAVRTAQLVQWRQHRQERHWPKHLVESTVWAWTEDPRVEENQ